MYFMMLSLCFPLEAKVGSISFQSAPSKKIMPSTQPLSSLHTFSQACYTFPVYPTTSFNGTSWLRSMAAISAA